jgi:hypothetical protein
MPTDGIKLGRGIPLVARAEGAPVLCRGLLGLGDHDPSLSNRLFSEF